MRRVTPEQIDELLPQTQCGLCGHGGCMPYSEALVFENAPINLCPPGGVPTLQSLGNLLKEDASIYIEEMAQKEKPPTVALIREHECIGCTKCIKACPVDAIIGTAKQMHTIVTDECTGCELCIPACPVDCIDLLPTNKPLIRSEEEKALSRTRFLAKEKRERAAVQQALPKKSLSIKQDYIQAALERAKRKKG